MNISSQEPTLSRKEREKLRNREAILEAAVHLFAQNGFTETKLEDVATLAEFGKGTLYNYFENKDDLLSSAFEYAIARVIQYLDERLADVSDPLDRLRLIVNAQFEYYRDEGDFLKVVMANQQIIAHAIHQGQGNDLLHKFHYLRKLTLVEIQKALDLKLLRPGNAERYAGYLSGMIHGQIRSLTNHEIELDDVDSDEIMNIFLNGVRHA